MKVILAPCLLLFLFSCSGLPKPDFTWFPEENAEAGDTIQFFNESKRSERFKWEFGDGGISNSSNPSYVYHTAGIFDVTLKAINDEGNNLVVQAIKIFEPTVLGFEVFDSTGMRSLGGSDVWVYDNQLARDQSYKPLYQGITDSIGRVVFRNIDPIIYHIKVFKEENGNFWNYRGYTNSLKEHKVNLYTVLCTL